MVIHVFDQDTQQLKLHVFLAGDLQRMNLLETLQQSDFWFPYLEA
jgi:hypothetical protein